MRDLQRLCLLCDVVRNQTQIWDLFVTTKLQIWDLFGTTKSQIWDVFDTTKLLLDFVLPI